MYRREHVHRGSLEQREYTEEEYKGTAEGVID